MDSGDLSRHDVEVFLLDLMRPTSRAISKLVDLGYSDVDMEASIERVHASGITQLPHSFALETRCLGRPETLESIPIPEDIGVALLDGGRLRLARFDLSAFEGYCLEVYVAPGDLVMDWRLARSRESEVPPIEGVDGLAPWSHVKSEVMPALKDVEMVDGFGYVQTFEATFSLGRERESRVSLHFVFDLLQDVELI